MDEPIRQGYIRYIGSGILGIDRVVISTSPQATTPGATWLYACLWHTDHSNYFFARGADFRRSILGSHLGLKQTLMHAVVSTLYFLTWRALDLLLLTIIPCLTIINNSSLSYLMGLRIPSSFSILLVNTDPLDHVCSAHIRYYPCSLSRIGAKHSYQESTAVSETVWMPVLMAYHKDKAYSQPQMSLLAFQ